jgi:hypothetical protein
VSIRIGPPLTLADLDAEGDDHDRHRRIAERLRAKVAELGPDDGGPAAVRLAG